MSSRAYGLRVFEHGVELRGDGRKRERLPSGRRVVVRETGKSSHRGKIRAWSEASAKRLAFIAANVALCFRSHVTLTYKAPQAAWETVGERNRRFVSRCKEDLHRFLRALREELGEYLWVREFQRRGVVHYHVLAEKDVTERRASESWSRASGQLGDEHVLRHGVKVDAIESQNGARRYLGQYIGKEKQKELPTGVDGAGRWWGRSRGLRLAMLEDVVWMDRSDGYRLPAQLRITHVLRSYIEHRFRRRYRGGAFLDYCGRLSAKLAELTVTLRSYYGWNLPLREFLEREGWELIVGLPKEGAEDGRGAAAGDEDAATEVGEEGSGDGRGAVQADLFAWEGGAAIDEGSGTDA